MMSKPTFRAVADYALLIELGTEVDDDINRAVIELDSAIVQANIDGLNEVVPALVSLLIMFDPIITDHMIIQSAVLELFPLGERQKTGSKRHNIDVCYEGEFGPDLDLVAQTCGMSVDAVIRAHTSAEYRVSMYGFAPGYAYLSGVPEIIQVPRKDTAVRDVSAGSVLIAGPQCLTTTLKMPTGWSIIGHSSVNIMTDDPEHPFLFGVGDTVTFKRIASDELRGSR